MEKRRKATNRVTVRSLGTPSFPPSRSRQREKSVFFGAAENRFFRTVLTPYSSSEARFCRARALLNRLSPLLFLGGDFLFSLLAFFLFITSSSWPRNV